MQEFVALFNKTRAANVNPGLIIVVDECMCSWRGVDSYAPMEGGVHITKIIRKPKSVGIEFKGAGDGNSGVLIMIEIQKGKNGPLMKYEGTYKHHCAMTLRLVEPWKDSHRIIVGDSAFSSVDTCKCLLDHGLYYLGVVKTCSSGYPKDYFKDWIKKNPERGTHCALTSNITAGDKEHPIIALSWCSRKEKSMNYIGTTSSTDNGNPLVVCRSVPANNGIPFDRITKQKSTPRPVFLNDLYKHFGCIDLHDRYRQGTLKLEIEWRTHTWWYRVFTTVFGMILTDAYLAYKYEFSLYAKNTLNFSACDTFIEFVGKLAYSFIFKYNNPTNTRNLGKNNNDNDDIKVNFYIFL